MKGKFVVLFVLTVISSVLISQMQSREEFSPYVDGSGNISRPEKYGDSWAHLGTYFVIGNSQEGHSMHLVYTEKRYLDSYNQTGEWPDGAVLVKEVMRTTGAQLTTGASNWATEPDVWFVMIKDKGQRFPDNPLWGEGWGWALFKSDAPNRQVATSYKRDCLNCHVPAKITDFVYIQGYPSIHHRRETIVQDPRRAAMTAAQSVVSDGSSAERGATVFAKACAICHSIDSDERKFGPGLAVIARQGKLPSGAEASPESILNQINNGGGGMPAFAEFLQPQQKADLIAYLRAPQ